jgi:hypothetical protein
MKERQKNRKQSRTLSLHLYAPNKEGLYLWICMSSAEGTLMVGVSKVNAILRDPGHICKKNTTVNTGNMERKEGVSHAKASRPGVSGSVDFPQTTFLC